MKSKSLTAKLMFLALSALIINQLACSNAGFGSKKGDQAKTNDVQGFAFDDDSDIGFVSIDANTGDGPIEWSRDLRNIYFNVSSNELCVTGLATSADDSNLNEKVARLERLLNSSNEISGTGQNFDGRASDLPSIDVGTDNGIKTYYLVDPSRIPGSEKTLSNRDAILDYYYDVLSELKSAGRRYCPGKGDPIY